MGKRRGHGEGTIFQEGERWRAQVSLADGRRVGKTCATRREAQRWMTQTLKALQDGLPVAPEKVTVGEFLDRWLQDVVQHRVRPRTLESYEMEVRVHLRPALGEIKLAALRPEQVQRLCAEKLSAGLSARSVQYMHGVLHRALRYAVKWGLVARNITELVDPPRPARKAMQTLTPEQARRFLEESRKDRLYALYLLAITTGMRRGELLGLHWKDVDLEKGHIQVTAAVQAIHGSGVVVTELKTARSRRMVAVPAMVVAAL